MSDPVSRTLLLLDIERYSDRDDVEQAYLRRMLYDVADQTLSAAGVDETLRQRADRGDGLIELIDANASLPTLLNALLTDAPVQLRSVNRMAASSAQIRLRAVLATGYVAVDAAGGWIGSDLNHAARLLDCAELRAALCERTGDLALCVSASVHHGIVRHGHPGIPPEEFHRITPDSKNGRLEAWLHGPPPSGADPAPGTAADGTDTATASSGTDSATAPAAQSGAAPGSVPGATFTFHGAPSFGGGLVGGDQYGVNGGQVTGDVILGGPGQGRTAQGRSA